MDNQTYLNELAAELAADETWEAPEMVKGILFVDLAWNLIDL